MSTFGLMARSLSASASVDASGRLPCWRASKLSRRTIRASTFLLIAPPGLRGFEPLSNVVQFHHPGKPAHELEAFNPF